MYAELVINIEAPLQNTFHYHIPSDLEGHLKQGHFVEVEFGRRLAQGIIVAFSLEAPVEDTKPIISLIDETPVVLPWQIGLAQTLSRQYLTPLNACLRLFLPPGLTRWADITLDINPRWDGSGRLTDNQKQLLDLLREKGDMRGRQINRSLPKQVDWRSAANQLVRRDILRKASHLDPPRVRPKVIKTAELTAPKFRFLDVADKVGRKNKQADVLIFLLRSSDPLPSIEAVIDKTGAGTGHLNSLIKVGLIREIAPETIYIPLVSPDQVSDNLAEILRRLPAPAASAEQISLVESLEDEGLVQRIEQPAAISLSVSRERALEEAYRLRGGIVYYRVLSFLTEAAVPVSVGELYRQTDSSMAHLRKLADLELLRFGQEMIWRDPMADKDFVPVEAPILTGDQAAVWEKVKETMDGRLLSGDEPEALSPVKQGDGIADPTLPATADLPPVILLHGVTGSGKTEIYLRAVEKALNHGQQAVILVPEIALTPQTVRRFAARFPGQVAILHSRLSDGERYDTWRRARQGKFSIVIGPRSALFTPFKNLGIVVVDEEHDQSYKQTPPVPPPYYHARRAAVSVAKVTKATIILGSATPDLVSYHKAQAGRYQLLELPRRIMGHRQRIAGQAARVQRESRYRQTTDDPEEALTIPLPPIQIVDLRQELRADNRSIFSRSLGDALDETLEREEQAILFLNRRGSATFVMCRDCGLVLNCPRCDSPLTFHRRERFLACHYCGRKEPPHQNCPRCGSRRIKYFGLGTEELERKVMERWPHARTIRWDRDTTAGKDAHEALLSTFIDGEADILVGTQMIAKGLDLPLVTLVGVISADVTLGLPDFGIGEKTFQILAQVAGRAGRGLLGGRVIIQTYQPDHYAIQAAAEHDYTQFYIEEIRFRTQHNLPPFRRLARLLFIDPVDSRAEREANRLANRLRTFIRDRALLATEVLGPTPPFFNRIDGRYRWQLILRSPDPLRLLQEFDIPANWIVDIDPVSIL